MSVYKNAKTGKWYCIFRVTDWTGKRKQIKKSGFARRADALEYERNYMAKEAGSLEMTFGALVDLYMADARARLRPTTYESKVWIFDKKSCRTSGTKTSRTSRPQKSENGRRSSWAKATLKPI